MNESEGMDKTGFSETLVLLQTKLNQAGEAYVVVGTFVGETEYCITLRRAVSPVIQSNSTIVFQQHMIPPVLIDERYINEVVTVVSKDYLTFFTLFRMEDPHPLCEEYQRFWAAADEVVATSLAAEADGSNPADPMPQWVPEEV